MNTTYRPDPVPIDAPGEPAVRLIPLGGLGEIGLNMMLIECGPDILAVDCGLLFPDDEMPGVDFAIPDFAYLRERRDAFRGVVLTHGHEDHIGALSYLLREFPVSDKAAKTVYETRQAIHRVLHGADDPHVPPEAVKKFKASLDAAKIPYTFVAYPGAVHSFTVKEAGDDPSKGSAYNAEADRLSWEEMTKLLRDVFSRRPS